MLGYILVKKKSVKQVDFYNEEDNKMNIVPYQEKYKKDFISLNLAWIKKYFRVEPQDIKMLNEVESFLTKGAAVYFAVEHELFMIH